jgi:hypothetical protein
MVRPSACLRQPPEKEQQAMAATLSDRLIRVGCTDLQPGMYVAELDRSWLQTPYPPGGFLLRDADQRSELQRHCAYVYVDPQRGTVNPVADGAPAPARPVNPDRPARDRITTIRSQLHALADGVEATFRAAREGDELPVAGLAWLAQPLQESLARDPDTVLWLLATAMKGGHLPRRALGTGLLMGLFSQRLRHGKEHAANLMLAGLLLDIGKLAVPMTILAKPGSLNDAERAFVRRHVRRGLYLARTAPNLPAAVEEAIIGHHERLDGSGYPRGCTGTQIPPAGRMAGIIDAYDALTLDRRYARGIPANAALRLLDAQSRTQFDAALLQFFAHVIGAWPTGSWVQLADGRIGIVRAQTPDEPRRPRIALVSDSAGRPLPLPARLWSPDRRSDLLRGLAPADFRLSKAVVAPALKAATLAA